MQLEVSMNFKIPFQVLSITIFQFMVVSCDSFSLLKEGKVEPSEVFNSCPPLRMVKGEAGKGAL